jgi:predicted nucleic acid-binding protein
MTLIDASSLVHFLRIKGNPAVKSRVANILRGGEAAICEMIAVELWMGVGSAKDKREIEELCSALEFLPIDESVWRRAKELATLCRKDGTPVPSSDAVIAACAFTHGAAIDCEDGHFAVLENHL